VQDDSATEKVGMQLKSTMLSRSKFSSADERLNLHETNLLPNQYFPMIKKTNEYKSNSRIQCNVFLKAEFMQHITTAVYV